MSERGLTRVFWPQKGHSSAVMSRSRARSHSPVRLVLVHDGRERGDAGVPPPERLGHVDVQPVVHEEPVLCREERERAGPRVGLGLDVLPDPPLQLLRHTQVVHGVSHAHEVRSLLVLRDGRVYAHVRLEHRPRMVRHCGYRLSEILRVSHLYNAPGNVLPCLK